MDSCFLVVCNWIILSNEQVNCVHLAQFKVGLWMFFCLRTKLQENWTIAAQARRHPNVKHFSCLYFIVYSKRWEDDIGVVRYLTCFSCYLPLPNWVIQEIPMNLKSIFSFISECTTSRDTTTKATRCGEACEGCTSWRLLFGPFLLEIAVAVLRAANNK